MPDYRKMFDSAWVKAWDLDGKAVTVTIEKVVGGVIEDKQKGKKDRLPIITFRGAKKPFGCNKTNAKTIAGMYGTKTEGWIGKSITIYPTTTMVGSEERDCIRVKPQIPTGKAVDLPEPPPAPSEDNDAPEAGE